VRSISSLVTRPRTQRPGADVALTSCGRRPPGPAWCPVYGCRDHGGSSGGPDALRYPQTAHVLSWADPVGIFRWQTSLSGLHHQGQECPGPTRLGLRRLGLSLSSQGQWPPATPSRKGPQADSGYQLEGAGTVVQALPTAHGTQEKCQSGCGRYRLGIGGLQVGHYPARTRDTLKPEPVSAIEKGKRFSSSIGRGAAPVWCNPRWRSQGARNPRA
jgi:hypothetical protein